jgi:hypothetical protein
VEELSLIIEASKPDIIIGNETWLDDSVKDSEVFPPEYTPLHRKDVNRKKHGVLLAIKNDLIHTDRDDLDTDCGLVWAQVEISKSQNILHVIGMEVLLMEW